MTEWGLSREALLASVLVVLPHHREFYLQKSHQVFIIKSKEDTLMILEEMEEEQPL